MELGRNVTLGQYVPGKSVVHRLDPRTKIVGWIVIATAMFVAGSLVGLGVVALLLVALIAVSGLPPSYVLRGLLPMLPFLLLLYVFQVLFSGSLYPDAETIYLDWGPLQVSAEGILGSTTVMVRVVLLYLSVTLLTLATSLVLLVDGMERLTAPLRRIGVPNQELAMVAGISVRFVPTLVEEAERLMKAQMARGSELDRGGVIARTRARLPILIPLFLNTLRRAGDLTTAMESRCYRGGEGRTKRRRLRLVGEDWAALGVCLGTAVLAVVLSRAFPLG